MRHRFCSLEIVNAGGKSEKPAHAEWRHRLALQTIENRVRLSELVRIGYVYELTHRAPEAGRRVKEHLSGMPPNLPTAGLRTLELIAFALMTSRPQNRIEPMKPGASLRSRPSSWLRFDTEAEVPWYGGLGAK